MLKFLIQFFSSRFKHLDNSSCLRICIIVQDVATHYIRLGSSSFAALMESKLTRIDSPISTSTPDGFLFDVMKRVPVFSVVQLKLCGPRIIRLRDDIFNK